MAELPERRLGPAAIIPMFWKDWAVSPMSRNMWALFLISGVLLLVSFSGGPTFVADLLKPGFGVAGFLAAIAPLMIALLGAFSFMEAAALCSRVWRA